ncbi:MAG TPA: DVUA0089 family protein [Candidatus Binatia bacterium]|jgi:hypothetical protein
MIERFFYKRAAQLFIALVLLLPAVAVRSANFSFRGTFTRDDNVQLFGFILGSPSTVTIRSFGYEGGTNAVGTVIPPGGFDTTVAVYNLLTGSLLGFNDDGSAPPLVVDPITGFVGDSLLNLSLGAGTYAVALTEFDNVPNGNFSAGFFEQGKGNFTPGLTGCSAPAFCAASLNAPGFSLRNGNWALDLLGVTAIASEPGSFMMFALGLGALGLFSQRKKFRLE